MRDDSAALAGSTQGQLATMPSLPPPLLPLAELLGDSADVSSSSSLAHTGCVGEHILPAF